MPNNARNHDYLSAETLEQLKKIEVSILLDVAKVCEKHGLTYFLIGGTLLGAIRHGGFIPWDDDIDIAMPRNDFETFQKIAETELPKSLFLHYGTTDAEYYLPIIKIKKHGTVFEEESISPSIKHKGIFIDIFPLDNAKRDKGFLFHMKGRILKQMRSILFLKINEKTTLYTVAIWKKALLRLLKLVPTKLLFQLITSYMQNDTNNSSAYYANYASKYGYQKQTMLKTVYEPTAITEFEGYRFRIPGETDYFLRRVYGQNYMDLPPAEKRITHKPRRIQLKEERLT
ncbi:LicD family protein [Listeria booriae]|uniref:LicD family protein n=1 Tax=Listeria booriae TaxID=1552123 RepID=A0A7X0TQ67_9LIST|nr:LicD family protein [Listeria booriae]MBC1228055.1 LicD family protein [Listeria booriae]MBC1234350.1 LicD family protein [Listeria booriae]MBC1247719.1 LicD family protein [Listeria booriae]MBC1271688.1 LicD family protein [Listeria booriae]MBC1307816.1 LicD family protein [Listeria booriae]